MITDDDLRTWPSIYKKSAQQLKTLQPGWTGDRENEPMPQSWAVRKSWAVRTIGLILTELICNRGLTPPSDLGPDPMGGMSMEFRKPFHLTIRTVEDEQLIHVFMMIDEQTGKSLDVEEHRFFDPEFLDNMLNQRIE